MLALGELSAGQLDIEGTGRFALGELGAGQLNIEDTERRALGELSSALCSWTLKVQEGLLFRTDGH